MTRPVDAPIPSEPKRPYPVVTGYVDIVPGFGRGSSALGIPTANVPIEQLPSIFNELPTGVYFGFAKLAKVEQHSSEVVETQNGRNVECNYGQHLEDEELRALPVVLSVGLNPFYGNKFKTVELHLIHKFDKDFYGAKVKFSLLGFIRPELDYSTKEALIKDINTDIKISQQVLGSPEYSRYKYEL